MSNEEQESEREEIELKHTYADSYQLHPATGVAGGIQPQGDLKIDFTYDHGFQTTSERYDQEERFLTALTVSSHMERERQVGISMNRQDAYDAAVWILSHVMGEDVTQQEIRNVLNNLMEESGT